MTATTIEYSLDNVPEIAERMKRGEVGIFPCDTIYGICAVVSEETSEKIYKAKERPENKRLLVLMDKAHLAASGLVVPEEIAALWPAALTVILGDKEGNTTAVRVPDDPFLKALLPLTGPIFSTSVNLSGQPSLQSYETILPVFGDRVDFIVRKENLVPGMSSTLVDGTQKPYKVIRQGAYRFEI